DLILPPESGDPPLVFLTPSPTSPTQPGSPVSPGSPGTPVTSPTLAPNVPAGDATAAELRILERCNQVRAENGAKPLTLDGPISQVARFRSTDMGTRNYFAHVDPDGHDAFYYLRQAGISYQTAGENIGQSSGTPDATVDRIFDAWMNSSGHKANILNKAYGRIGIGAVQTGSKTYYTQVFAN
ncbi:MAG: CAP domain-containing protein, partial [Bacteroidota bacterium]